VVAGFAVAQSTTSAIRASSDPRVTSLFWTSDRAADAQAMPFYDADADGAQAAAPQALGPAGSVAGGVGGGNLQADAAPFAAEAAGAPVGDAAALALLSDGEDVGVAGTANIHDNDYVNLRTTLWRQYPYRTIGKLLFTNASGGGSYCTASVISPNNIVVTAAHCCYTRGQGWHSNFAFVPAMRVATRPYGTFPWVQARILTAWITSGGRHNDVCLVRLGPNANGQRVSTLVGWLGRSWNFPNVQHHFAFGYPSNISSGNYKYEASAESYANCGNPSVNAMGSNMTFGSSGGPWVRVFKRFTSGAMNYVNTVVSGYDNCTGTFGQSFNGARFTSNNIVPLCTAEGC
jgi:V8-like Glu-specific endopeptidase